MVRFFVFKIHVDHRDLHVLTHSFPTRRSTDLLLPPEIQRMADSPNMDDRNAAFMEMARIDPKRAFQIQSDARDASLERLKGGQEALRIRSEEHTSELQSLMRTSYAVFCLKKNIHNNQREYQVYVRYNDH